MTSTNNEGLRREIGILGLAANTLNRTIGAGIFVLPAFVASFLGETPTSFAISPDGSLVVVTNAKKSYYPWDNNDSSKKASISLLKLTSDGSLNNVADYEFEGILPKNIVFDKSGENLAVSVFDYFNFGKHFGGIEFWKVKNGDKPSLQKQDFKLFMPRGCHGIQIVK